MNIPKKDRSGYLTFAEFAKDHNEHAHCLLCNGCLVDPSPLVRHSFPTWCVGCRDKTKQQLHPGQRPPWMWEVPRG